MKIKKICIDARMLEHSGIGTYLRNLLPRMASQNISITLIVSPTSVENFPWLRSQDLIFCTASIYSMREQMQLPQLIPACDLFWSPHFNVPLLPIRAKKRLVTIHDLYHLAYFSTLRLVEKFYAKLVISQATRRADRVITDSSFTLSEIKKYFPQMSHKVSVIPCGVDFTQYAQGLEWARLQEIKVRCSLPENYFLFVGNLKPHKNLKGLVRAFQLLVREKEAVSLVIVGKEQGLRHGESFEDLMKEFPLLEHKVLWLKEISQEDLPAIYRLAKGMVFPSFYEGFGLPPLEAMASGCPVVASRIASIPEICEDAAVLVDPYDPASIKEAMKTLLEDAAFCDRLIEAGKRRAQEFSWDQCAKKHLEVIESIIYENSACP